MLILETVEDRNLDFMVYYGLIRKKVTDLAHDNYSITVSFDRGNVERFIQIQDIKSQQSTD